MQYKCPVCNADGDVPENADDRAVAKVRCAQCSAILMVDPRSGSVDAHKAGLKDAPRLGEGGNDDAGEAPTVLSMGKHGEQRRDWPAVIVVAVVLLALVAAGLWLVPVILQVLTGYTATIELSLSR